MEKKYINNIDYNNKKISVTFKNPYKYPHFSTDQYNIIKMHSLFLGIWMILLLLWLCAWINKIKVINIILYILFYYISKFLLIYLNIFRLNYH